MYGKQVLAERLVTRSQKACFRLVYCGLEEPFSVHRTPDSVDTRSGGGLETCQNGA